MMNAGQVMIHSKTFLFSCCAVLTGLAILGAQQQPPKGPAQKWIRLFNGKNLSGWTPKIVNIRFMF